MRLRNNPYFRSCRAKSRHADKDVSTSLDTNGSVEKGFALAETLVATAIIAAMLGVTFQSIESGARQTRMIEDRRQAMLIAQSQLTAVGSAQSTSLGETSGITSGIRWRLSVQPYRANQQSGAKLELVSLTAGLEREKRDLVILKTIRVSR
jgi:type II secretory pathway pseudopilin PulG